MTTAPTAPGRPERPLPVPVAATRREEGRVLPQLLWRLAPGSRVCSTAVFGGGIGERRWVLNAQVPAGYRRTDPAAHLAQIAGAAGLRGPGAGLMTAADVSRATEAHDDGVHAVVTTGLGVRTWAASPAPGAPGAPPAGTVNIVVSLPAPLADAALVNAVATATEAKVQALLDAGLDCSGTPSDAVAVIVPALAPGRTAEPFAGPRSRWGAPLARAVHAAVLAGAAADRADGKSAPGRNVPPARAAQAHPGRPSER
ncbi:adenosylcobinamide amidohydrolase [Streptomyces sp. 549]|uniref:adenosylcobinamide amidohydrolase n=1 Tax=Streptomyces sp. 549 TaxID=3049076 RepID=UPI0024C2E989|nr:adenosylcobinamide amidohydrolase [Streptomyces sp. 549]MDK1476695.1 adenosylcobinamide amidohydrolase [Streptomyces sp. 549]